MFTELASNDSLSQIQGSFAIFEIKSTTFSIAFKTNTCGITTSGIYFGRSAANFD